MIILAILSKNLESIISSELLLGTEDQFSTEQVLCLFLYV